MKKILSLALLCVAMCIGGLRAQNALVVAMTDSVDGSSYTYGPGMTFTITDDNQGPSGRYTFDKDVTIHVTGSCTGSTSHLCIQLSMIDIRCCDTLYMYDGPNTSAPVLAKINSFTGDNEGDLYFISPNNTTGEFTLRFVTRSAYDSEDPDDPCFKPYRGFSLKVQCTKPCERVVPVIEPVFDRTRGGEVYAHDSIRKVYTVDTVFAVNNRGEVVYETVDGVRKPIIQSIDTTGWYWGAHLCIGDGVIFHGRGDYSYKYGYYTPSDLTTYFVWDMGHGEGIDFDTIEGYGVTSAEYEGYQEIGCSDVFLTITDEFGCASTELATVKVRTASNPIKTVYTLADICNNDSLLVNLGYDGDNATLTLKEIKENLVVTKKNENRVFIPDGGNCNGMPYYEAPVTFTEYGASMKVQSAEDICSICINYEHSYMGDYRISIVCPTGQEATLKWGNYSAGLPSGPGGSSETGGSTFTGIPLDGFNGYGDNYNNKCDSLTNPFGYGYDYCFSRNSAYTLVTGQSANYGLPGTVHPTGNFYLGSSAYTESVTFTFPAGWIPAGFAQGGSTPGTGTVTTKHPSDYENKLDYYLPYTDFSELVGCPLNGTWNLRFYDDWGSDNGWVFAWWMDICNVTTDEDCKYEVPIDSLVWEPDPSPQYHDYDLGRYRGAEVHRLTPLINYILTPDTAGTFPILVHAYDAFGCIWDTTTSITSFWTPLPSLGSDTSLCGIDKMELDASDLHSDSLHFTYLWEPNGDTTSTMFTIPNVNADITYMVQVTNAERNQRCIGRDTLIVKQRKQPIPNIEPSIFPLEGCGPLTVRFDNNTVDAESVFWDFGDGVTSQEFSPSHIYAPGNYELRYYVSSGEGCIDSLYPYPVVTVFDTPKAAFSWDPVYPTVVAPVIHMHNESETELPGTIYRWEVQYDRDNFLSVQTLTTAEGDYRFTSDDHDVAGNYTLRLIARTDNVGPSGTLTRCADTAENAILLVNDFLQFPNVVSPNGDGINDRFVINNLIDGKGYPINTLDIYNKWGSLVFHKDNITTDDDFWDPSDVPDGTYFFRFVARGYNGNIERNGAVEVVR